MALDTPPLALGILTRGRLNDVTTCVESALNSAVGDFRVFACFDDDPANADLFAARFAAEPRVHTRCLPIRHYYTRGMNRLYEWMRVNDVEHFVVSNDDVRFVRMAWDVYALAEHHDRLPIGGILELAGPDLAAHYLSTVSFVEKHLDGRIAEEEYTFYCSDTELRERCRRLGAYAVAQNGEYLRHLVKQDRIRSEVSYWLPFDRETYKRRWQPGWKKEVWQL